MNKTSRVSRVIYDSITHLLRYVVGIGVVEHLNYSVLILTPLFRRKLAIKANKIIITRGTIKAFQSSIDPIPKNPSLKESII